jgi:glycosyltransferase involved in cell wall biosynthesis
VLPPWLVRAIVVQSRLVYDFDDALFVPEPERTRAMVQAAWRVVAGSHALAEYASRFNAHTALVPSAVALAPSVPPPPPHGHLPCIGWIGSAGTLPQLAMLAEPLRRLAAAGERFQVLIAGTEGLRDLLPELPGIRVREVQTYTGADIQSLVSELDIGVMPLNDGPWERGKCAMKALLYMAGGRAVVASAVGENRYAVQHGENGFLAATSDEWVEYLGRLLRDRPLRDHMGSRGLEAVAERYSTEVCYRLLWEHVYADL